MKAPLPQEPSLVALRNRLEELLCQTQQLIPLNDSDGLPPDGLPSKVVKIQGHFQSLIVQLAQMPLDFTLEQQLRPLQTEAHRQLRLMGIEAMRWQTARQDEARRSQLLNHVETFYSFLKKMAEVIGQQPPSADL